jgi:competence protein ComEC
VIRDGHPGETKTWKDSDTAIRNEVTTEGCKDNNLKDVTLKPGTPFKIGDVTVVFACGFYDLPDDWQLTKDNEKINARSVVVRLDYAGKSILFAGGTVGRHIGDRADTCIAAEKFMIDKDCKVPLHSQVLIAPHHGADNAGTPRWLRAVSPQYIVFSAGHKFKHPCQIVADRYMDVVPLENIFRTGIGDN